MYYNIKTKMYQKLETNALYATIKTLKSSGMT